VLYSVDADDIIRVHHFGEERYEQSERVIQRLLGVERGFVSVEGLGNWDHLTTPETYLARGRLVSTASADRLADTARDRMLVRSGRERRVGELVSLLAARVAPTRARW
jgi:hypothetical protein